VVDPAGGAFSQVGWAGADQARFSPFCGMGSFVLSYDFFPRRFFKKGFFSLRPLAGDQPLCPSPIVRSLLGRCAGLFHPPFFSVPRVSQVWVFTPYAHLFLA